MLARGELPPLPAGDFLGLNKLSRERGIVMSGDNPKLILDGRKTQTRRIIKPQPPRSEWTRVKEYADSGMSEVQPNYFMRCPYGVAGDRLWVRETFWEELYPTKNSPKVYYCADGTCPRGDQVVCKRPSIHMPRWASRITLEITKVRVERLQDISEEDAIAEGFDPPPAYMSLSAKYFCKSTREQYRELWDSLHGKGAWDKNPWVWVIEFKRA